MCSYFENCYTSTSTFLKDGCLLVLVPSTTRVVHVWPVEIGDINLNLFKYDPVFLRNEENQVKMTNLILTSSPWLPLGAPNVPTPQPTNEMVVGTC